MQSEEKEEKISVLMDKARFKSSSSEAKRVFSFPREKPRREKKDKQVFVFLWKAEVFAESKVKANNEAEARKLAEQGYDEDFKRNQKKLLNWKIIGVKADKK